MEWLSGWMSNLIIFLLAAFLLELLLPSSSMQKYARLVLSFILMLLIIEPLVFLTNSQPEERWEQQLLDFSYEEASTDSIEIEWNQKKNEIEEGQDAYISKQVSNQLVQEVEETLKERWGWGIQKIDIDWKGEELEVMDQVMVRLVLAEVTSEDEQEEQADIEPIRIEVENTENETSTKMFNEKQEVLAYLEETWEIEAEQINLSLVEGGG